MSLYTRKHPQNLAVTKNKVNFARIKQNSPWLKRFDLELKILRGDLEKTIEKGLQQTWEYMDISGGVEEGHLIIFDRSKTRPWEEKIWRREMDYQGHPITVWGM